MDANGRAVWNGQLIALQNLCQQVADEYGWGSEQEKVAYEAILEHADKLNFKDKLIVNYQGLIEEIKAIRAQHRFEKENPPQETGGRHRLIED